MTTGDLARCIYDAFRKKLHVQSGRPFVLGICGSQGSGKSTVALALCHLLADNGLSAAVLSLDDLYLGQQDRRALASARHPLLAVRGVPGTHDVDLGLRVLDASGESGHALLPRFDKARDDRCPADRWDVVAAPVDVVIFEGWFVGARPQSEEELARPVNALERDRDGDGRWRHWVNAQLADGYQALFARLDALVLLAAPSFDVVGEWRLEQEQALRRERGGGMSDAEVSAFIHYFQRLTEHILRDMPRYADLVITLARDRRPVGLRHRSAAHPIKRQENERATADA